MVDLGMLLAGENQLGAAQLMAKASMGCPGADALKDAVAALAARNPELQSWGGGDAQLGRFFQSLVPGPSEPCVNAVLRLENRGRILDFLKTSSRPETREVLRCRALTNTTFFDPSGSSSGQALDAAVSICGLLLEGGRLSPRLTAAISGLAAKANQGGGSRGLERVLLDFASLAQRYNWGQLIALAARIEDENTLRILADQTRQDDSRSGLAELFAAIGLAGKPQAVADYLAARGPSGLSDLGFCLRFNSGGLNELLRRNQRPHVSVFRARMAGAAPLAACMAAMDEWCWVAPRLGTALKWGSFFGAGLLLTMAARLAGRPSGRAPAAAPGERGIRAARHCLFAAGFLLLMLLLSEPFAPPQTQQNGAFSLRVRLPAAGTFPAGAALSTPKFMDNVINLLTLAAFFVIQGLIYVSCLAKLAEIRREAVPPQLRLRLLENEDHLFDAGLYLGFVGTILSLILVSLGVIKFSLMAAYSSTSFGIIFVSLFKIFHLRPARRALLMEVDQEEREAAAMTIAAASRPPSPDAASRGAKTPTPP